MKKHIFIVFFVVAFAYVLVACAKKTGGAGDYKTRKFKGNPQKTQADKKKYSKY